MTPAGRIGIIVGLPQEAAILQKLLGDRAPPIRCAGAQPLRAASGARELIAAGAQSLISFGLAGGIDPRMRPGDIVVADSVTAPDGRDYPVDAKLRQLLTHALRADGPPCRNGVLAGIDRVLASAADKQALAARTGALAVDMESHAVAAAGRPFAVLRVIIDPAERAIPAAVLAALGPSGGINPLRLLGGLARDPGAIGALWALARDNRAARRSLRYAAAALGRLT